MSERMVVKTNRGKFLVDVMEDMEYPGIDVEYIADNEMDGNVSRPRILVEKPLNHDVRALIWNDPMTEDYKHEIELHPVLQEKLNQKILVSMNRQNSLNAIVYNGRIVASKHKENGVMIEFMAYYENEHFHFRPSVLIREEDNGQIMAYIRNNPERKDHLEKINMTPVEEVKVGMDIHNLILELQEIEKKYPNTCVRMHHPDGDGIMFAVAGKDMDNGQCCIWLEGREDIDAISELQSQYEHAAEIQQDELDFFTNMLNRGFTLDDFKEALEPGQFVNAQKYMEEHGLI